MQMKTFSLEMYEYEDFIEDINDYLFDKITNYGQRQFFWGILGCISEEAFLDWIKLGLTAVFVIDGQAREEFPPEMRHWYAEIKDAAFILYCP